MCFGRRIGEELSLLCVYVAALQGGVTRDHVGIDISISTLVDDKKRLQILVPGVSGVTGWSD